MRETKYFYRGGLSWCRGMLVPFFLIICFAGCASLSPMDVPGTYIPAGSSYHSDTLFLFPPVSSFAYGLPEGQSVSGKYHHVYRDSTGIAHTRDSIYILSHLPKEFQKKGTFMAQLEGWRFPNNADSLQDFWVVSVRNDSLTIRSHFTDEPVFLQVAKVTYHWKHRSWLFF